MEMINAHELVGCFQTVYWNEWKIKSTVEFELVDAFKAPVLKEGNGLYQVYYAICGKDYPPLGMKAGDNIFLHIAYRALLKALFKLPVEFKAACLKENADGKNIFIKFQRTNETSFTVLYQEPREPTAEHIANSKRYYEIIKSEHAGQNE